jgi:hypothetical protein
VYEEHPCTDIELIEESFDSIPWLCVYSLCVDVMLMNVCFCHAFAFICCVCDFMVELKSERKSE